jgi:Ca2+-binding EF-hand superfamily protein
MLDGNGNGRITESDLGSMLRSIGIHHNGTKRINIPGLDSSPTNIKKMLSELYTPLDFPTFLTYITSLKSQISSHEELVNAFTSFDDHDSGYINADILRNDLTTTGPQRMTNEQVDAALRGFIEKTGKHKGKIAYIKFLEAMTGEQLPT